MGFFQYENLLRRLLSHQANDRPDAKDLELNMRHDVHPDDYEKVLFSHGKSSSTSDLRLSCFRVI